MSAISPEPDYRIRTAGAEDVPAIIRLAGIVWRSHYPGIISPGQIDYMLERMYAPEVLKTEMTSDGVVYWVAENCKDGDVCAFASAGPGGGAGELKLHKLYVRPDRQRTGLGGRLLLQVRERAASIGASRLVLCVNKANTQALAAYVRYGFVVRRPLCIDIGGGYLMDDFEMELGL